MLNPGSLSPPVVANVEIRLSPEGIALFGSITTKEPDRSLGAFFRTVHAEALKRGLTELRVDVRGLSFVNSSAIRAFVDWISRAAHAGYTLAFKTSPSVTWHRLSFSVLKSLAPATVEIVEARAGGGASP